MLFSSAWKCYKNKCTSWQFLIKSINYSQMCWSVKASISKVISKAKMMSGNDKVAKTKVQINLGMYNLLSQLII